MAFKFNPITGKLDTVRSDSEIRGLLSATSPVVYTSSTGVISFDTATTALTSYLKLDASNDPLTGTLTITPSSDVGALVLNEFAASPASSIFQVNNSSAALKWDFRKTSLDTSTAIGWNIAFDTSSAVSPSTSRTGISVTLSAGYTGSASTACLAFDNVTLGTQTGYTNDTSSFGYRPTGPVVGVGGYARGVTAGVQVALEGIAGGSASSAYGGWLGATRERTGGQAIGGIGVARNTVGTAFGLAAVLGSRTTKPITRSTSAALLADNGDQAVDIFAAQSAETDVFVINTNGATTLTPKATSGGVTAFTIFPGAHTAVTTQKNSLYIRGNTVTITGSFAEQNTVLIDGQTFDAGTAQTITTASTFTIGGAPLATNSAVITNAYAFWVKAGNARLDGNVSVGVTTPTARLHLAAGTTTANTAPLKFTSGTSLTTAEAGAMEFTTDDLYFTITTGAARKGVILNNGSNLTSGRVPFATTNGRLTDDADLTFATDTLTATKIVGSTSVKVGTAGGFISSDGSTGATGTFTTADLKTVTVKDGIITSIV